MKNNILITMAILILVGLAVQGILEWQRGYWYPPSSVSFMVL